MYTFMEVTLRDNRLLFLVTKENDPLITVPAEIVGPKVPTDMSDDDAASILENVLIVNGINYVVKEGESKFLILGPLDEGTSVLQIYHSVKWVREDMITKDFKAYASLVTVMVKLGYSVNYKSAIDLLGPDFRSTELLDNHDN